MVRIYVAVGCRNRSDRMRETVNLNRFPKDERLKSDWTRLALSRAIRLTKPRCPGPSPATVLCSEHLKHDDLIDIDCQLELMRGFEIPYKTVHI